MEIQKVRFVKCSWVLVAVLGATIMLAACGGEPTVDPLEIGDPERGREIFETGGGVLTGDGCIKCHSLDGSENVAPTMLGISARAGERVPGLSAVDYLRQSIVDPRAYFVEGFPLPMSTQLRNILSEEDIDALVAFLLTQ